MFYEKIVKSHPEERSCSLINHVRIIVSETALLIVVVYVKMSIQRNESFSKIAAPVVLIFK